jgi:hypothetical protein
MAICTVNLVLEQKLVESDAAFRARVERAGEAGRYVRPDDDALKPQTFADAVLLQAAADAKKIAENAMAEMLALARKAPADTDTAQIKGDTDAAQARPRAEFDPMTAAIDGLTTNFVITAIIEGLRRRVTQAEHASSLRIAGLENDYAHAQCHIANLGAELSDAHLKAALSRKV